jgi:putative acetyltransferase
MPHSSQTEAAIVDALRGTGALAISLVAVQDTAIVGHAALSPVRIDDVDGGWYGLGPVSVAPSEQRKGIGKALIGEGLGRLRHMGARGCVVLGDPAYYGRFGFANDPALRYGDVPPPYLQRLVFAGAPPNGVVAFHAGFDAT